MQLHAFDPRLGGLTDATVALYGYSGGVLTSSWDPRAARSPNDADQLKATYGYDDAGRLASVGPAATSPGGVPALTPTVVGYDEHGRLRNTTRIRPEGGPAVQRVVYGLDPTPPPGRDLPDLSYDRVKTWQGPSAQPPVAGAAVFGPDHPIGEQPGEQDWTWASVAYWDGYGRASHTGVWGAGQWLIDSVRYDNTLWYPASSLSAGNRAAVFDADCRLAVVVCAQPSPARKAALLTDITVRSGGDPALVVWDIGPAVDTVSDAGDPISSRPWTTTRYDQDAPNGGVAPDTGLPYRLPTTETTATLRLDRIAGDPTSVDPDPDAVGDALIDPTLALTKYDAALGASGWGLRAATRTVSFTGNGSTEKASDAIIDLTIYDARGNVIARVPGGARADQAGTTLVDSYGPWANSGDCRRHYQWAGLTCVAKQAAAPDGGSGERLVTTTTGYSMLLAATTSRTTAGPATATSTTGYDRAGRVTSLRQVETGSGRGGWPDPAPVGDTSYGYDPATGLRETVTTAATPDLPAQTISSDHDAWGRETIYTDAAGATTRTRYDDAGRVAAVDTGKTTIGYGYDGDVNDHRGLTSSTRYTLPEPLRQQLGRDTVTTGWDTQGAPTTTGLTGVVSTTTVDAAGATVAVTHSQPAAGDPATAIGVFTQTVDNFGRTRGSDAATQLTSRDVDAVDPGFRRGYRYDNADRLLAAVTAGSGVSGAGSNRCTARGYTLAKDATRTETRTTNTVNGQPAWSPTGDDVCQQPTRQTGRSIDRDYNGYGQLLTSSDRPAFGGPGDTVTGAYGYDRMGRVTVTPGVDTASGTAVLTGYYADDKVRGTATGVGQDNKIVWSVRTYGRDPLARSDHWTDTTTTGPNPLTRRQANQPPDYQQHYSSDADSPTWAVNKTGQVDQWLPAPDGSIAANLSDARPGDYGTITLTDLHGDAALTIPLGHRGTGSETSDLPIYQLFDPYGTPTHTNTPNPSTGPADPGGSSYGYLYNDQRPRQTTSGLTLMGARLYNPTTGTFTTPDPIPDGNPNPYTYPPDPVNTADSSGTTRYRVRASAWRPEGKHWVYFRQGSAKFGFRKNCRVKHNLCNVGAIMHTLMIGRAEGIRPGPQAGSYRVKYSLVLPFHTDTYWMGSEIWSHIKITVVYEFGRGQWGVPGELGVLSARCEMIDKSQECPDFVNYDINRKKYAPYGDAGRHWYRGRPPK